MPKGMRAKGQLGESVCGGQANEGDAMKQLFSRRGRSRESGEAEREESPKDAWSSEEDEAEVGVACDRKELGQGARRD